MKADRQHVIIAYSRVSTDEQADSGAGMAAQKTALEAEITRRGAVALWIEDAGYSAKSLRRPGVQEALDLLAAGRADTLLVAKLDRATRSVGDLTALLERSRREGWAFVALDVAMDSGSPSGEALWSMMGVFSQLERRLIAARTKDALAEKRKQGVEIGRPVTMAQETRQKVAALRAGGMSPERIAVEMNAQDVPTAHAGARWHPSTVRKVLASIENKRELAVLQIAANS
jgi:DNA invertase Pin-like site-specific DNA recombinase